jgi:hypothetical protein
MKTLLITVVFLIIGFITKAQSYNISGIKKYCEVDKPDFRERYLKLFLKDSLVKEKIHTKDDGTFIINGLKKAPYTIVFTNVFGQRVTEKIDFLNSKSTILLCVDKFNDTKTETNFGNVITNDKITINFKSQGCEHLGKEKLEFTFKDNYIIAQLTNLEGKKTETLNLDFIEKLSNFEKQLKEIVDGMGTCTTTDTFNFSVNENTVFTIEDSSCDWTGYLTLKKSIFNR